MAHGCREFWSLNMETKQCILLMRTLPSSVVVGNVAFRGSIVTSLAFAYKIMVRHICGLSNNTNFGERGSART